MRLVVAAFAGLSLVGCASAPLPPNMPSGDAAYALMPAHSAAAAAVEAPAYRIGPLDTLDVNVFGEPDLSAKSLQVDASGNIALPLIGTVNTTGKTPAELSAEIQRQLGGRYLRNPQVAVTVGASVSQKVSIEGEVREPGVYPMTGPTTLLGVIAMAKGETDYATLRQVVVFRTVDKQRMGAVFDVAEIRRGQVPDPVMQGNDLVVVGYSAAKRFWKNVVTAAPIFGIFRPLGI